jgi:hypothetical protein
MTVGTLPPAEHRFHPCRDLPLENSQPTVALSPVDGKGGVMRNPRVFWLPRKKRFTDVIALGIAADSSMHSPVAIAAPATLDCGIVPCSVYLPH